MRKINEKIVPMNVASLTLDFVMDSEKNVSCIVKHPSGAILDITNHADELDEILEEIVRTSINEIANLEKSQS